MLAAGKQILQLDWHAAEQAGRDMTSNPALKACKVLLLFTRRNAKIT